MSSWDIEMCSCSTSGTFERRLWRAFFRFYFFHALQTYGSVPVSLRWLLDTAQVSCGHWKSPWWSFWDSWAHWIAFSWSSLYCPGQPALGDSAWEEWTWQDDLKRSLSTSTMVWISLLSQSVFLTLQWINLHPGSSISPTIPCVNLLMSCLAHLYVMFFHTVLQPGPTHR